MRKGEIACNKQFLLFSQCFLPYMVFIFHLNALKNVVCNLFQFGPGNGLTLSQTTNFWLFQIERVCRRQFQIGWKWQKALQMGRKHWGKRRNCSLWAISPFPSVFLKDLYYRHVKSRVCLEKGEVKLFLLSANAFNVDQSQNLSLVKPLPPEFEQTWRRHHSKKSLEKLVTIYIIFSCYPKDNL